MLTKISRLLIKSHKYTQLKLSFSYYQISKQLGFTENFDKAIKSKLQKRQKDQFLRLQIFAGQGCQGFTYKFKFDNQLKETDYVYKLQKQSNVKSNDKLTISLNVESNTNLNVESNVNKNVVFAANGEEMKLLKGAVIDYSEEMMRSIFYVKENPNAEISCSCKTSFSPKDYVF